MSSIYHPATSGETEHFVQTFKQEVRAAKGDPGALSIKLMRLNNSLEYNQPNCFLIEL